MPSDISLCLRKLWWTTGMLPISGRGPGPRDLSCRSRPLLVSSSLPGPARDPHLRCAVRRSRRHRSPGTAGGRTAAPTPRARTAARRAGGTAGTRDAEAAGAAGRALGPAGRRQRRPGRGARSAVEAASQKRRRWTRVGEKDNSG